MKFEDFQSEINIRQKRVESLSHEIKEMKHFIDDLKQDIDIKSNELKQIRNEAHREIKYAIFEV
jgi:prefoldin subunit 5